MSRENDRAGGMALAALILGIFSFCCCCFNGVTGVLAIILGSLELGRINRSASSERGRWMAVAGIVLGIIAVVKDLAGALWIFFFGGLGVLQGIMQGY